MLTKQLIRNATIVTAFLALTIGVHGQKNPIYHPSGTPVPPNLERKVVQAKQYDLSVSLEITELGHDYYQLGATVRNNSAYDRPAGGKVVFSREGHGDILPATFGGAVDTREKWGHQRIGAHALPALKAGESITYSWQAGGRGDFYAHLEEVVFDNNTSNNRSDKSNLLSQTTLVGGGDFKRWFIPEVSTISLSRVSIQGATGYIEIPGLIPKTGFHAPTVVYDEHGLGIRTRVAISAQNISLKDCFIEISWADTPENHRLMFKIRGPSNGTTFHVGGDSFTRSVYSDVYYQDLAGGSYTQLEVRIDFGLRYDAEKQLFKLEGPAHVEGFEFVEHLSKDRTEYKTSDSLKKMFSDVGPRINSAIAAAIESKRAEIEWNFNTKMRKVCLTDKFGNGGAVDLLSLGSQEFTLLGRVPADSAAHQSSAIGCGRLYEDLHSPTN